MARRSSSPARRARGTSRTSSRSRDEAVLCSTCGDSHPVPMARCQRVNGWKNYETWATALWFSNGQGSVEYWREQAVEVLSRHSARKADHQRYSDATVELADVMKDQTEEGATEEGAPRKVHGLYADLLNAALSEVEWRDIAEHYIDAVLEERTRGR